MKQKDSVKKRDSNIEALRVLAILLIIVSHISWHGYRNVMEYGDIPSALNELILRVSCLGNVGSVIFVMISGYFLCKRTGIDWNKFIHLVLQVLSYSLLFYFTIYIVYFHNSITPSELFKAMTPVMHKSSWFYTAYILLYLSHPFLNKLITVLNKREFRNLILGMIVLFSLVQTFFMVYLETGYLIEFFLFYFIGAYIRLYPNNSINKNKGKILLIMIIIWIATPVLLKMIDANNYLYSLYGYMQHRTSPITLLIASSLLCRFLSVEIGSIRWLNIIASAVGGVYLIDDNMYIRPLLYDVILPLQNTINSSLIGLYLIGFTFAILLISSVIEIIRNALEKVLFPYSTLNEMLKKYEGKN